MKISNYRYYLEYPYAKMGLDEKLRRNHILKETKNKLLIDIFISKEPYIKNIAKDKIINLTGESGSGKSYFFKTIFLGNIKYNTE